VHILLSYLYDDDEITESLIRYTSTTTFLFLNSEMMNIQGWIVCERWTDGPDLGLHSWFAYWARLSLGYLFLLCWRYIALLGFEALLLELRLDESLEGMEIV